jgi:hypothetical protein
MHYNGQDFEVQIEAGINLATGQVFAHFYSIDPDTSLPPDVLTGFLPPEDGTGRGMGHVSYLIDQKPGLATGTEIRNIALISFDGQPWIATNQIDPHNPAAGTDPAKEALNTIDAGAPTSAVQPLPPTRTRPDFLVQWTSTDDAGGSGVASHDIYVATDGGSYVLWKDDITATSATFTGQAGHSYAFYSVAQDHVGNTEAAPATPTPPPGSSTASPSPPLPPMPAAPPSASTARSTPPPSTSTPPRPVARARPTSRSSAPRPAPSPARSSSTTTSRASASSRPAVHWRPIPTP